MPPGVVRNNSWFVQDCLYIVCGCCDIPQRKTEIAQRPETGPSNPKIFMIWCVTEKSANPWHGPLMKINSRGDMKPFHPHAGSQQCAWVTRCPPTHLRTKLSPFPKALGPESESQDFTWLGSPRLCSLDTWKIYYSALDVGVTKLDMICEKPV